jgi:hypothetical protein
MTGLVVVCSVLPEDLNYLMLSPEDRRRAHQNIGSLAAGEHGPGKDQSSSEQLPLELLFESPTLLTPPTVTQIVCEAPPSICVLLEEIVQELGDPVFAPVLSALRLVIVSLSRGQDLGDVIFLVTSQTEYCEGLFEPLAGGATLKEALEYVARSVRPKSARQVIAIMNALCSGIRADAPLGEYRTS